MSIQALPQTTVRAIGASQVLTDPAAVVKELVDNALDARATIISVEIHANTLDLIQVRDNGHGIAPQDRALVARRYCTSKITGEDDLKSIGGSSLGFRGEALASAAEMSGSLTITTRIESEQVATALKINQQGEIAGQDRASSSIGTTVRITDFIKANPVRRQVTLKRADQCLKRVKQLLQGYAFARPHVRLSLRVIKAKNDKGNWMYAPKTGGNAEDAAFKIVGAACASQCIWSVVESHGFTMQAFLPKVDATTDKVSNIGSFLSIDGRPVSVTRGTPKQVIKIYRETMKKSSTNFEGIKDPFIYLEIACPEASYDPNIEPAKDDVLFENPDEVIGATRELFSSVYPVLNDKSRASPRAEEPASNVVHSPFLAHQNEDDYDGFVTSLESHAMGMPAITPTILQKSPPTTPGHDEVENVAPTTPMTGKPMAPPMRQSFRSNMYGCDEEYLEALDARPSTGRTEADFDELRQARKDVNVSNPWVMAKLHSTVRPPPAMQDDQPVQTEDAIDRHQVPDALTSAHTEATGLPTPRPSSPSGPKPRFHPSDFVPDVQLARDGRMIGSSSLPPGQHFVTSSPSPAMPDVLPQPRERELQPPPAYNYGVTPDQENPPGGTPLSAIPQARAGARSSPRKQPRLNKPFVSPLVHGPPKERVWFDHLEGVEARRQPRHYPRHQQKEANGLVTQGELGDLIEDPRPLTPPRRNRDIRDFVDFVELTDDGAAASLVERRNFAAKSLNRSKSDVQDENVPNNYGALVGRGFVPASELAALEARMGSLEKPVARPPKRQKTGERVLRQISGNVPRQSPPLADEDEYRPDTGSRKMSRRRSSAKLQRTKSSKLPLERIPAGKGTHNLALKIKLSTGDISALDPTIDGNTSLLAWNEPAIDAYEIFAAQQTPDEIAAIGVKLHELLINRVNDGEMVQDLGDLVERGLQVHLQMLAAEELEPSQVETEIDVSQV